ncbi:tRNA pseudouridine(38-40) synthase TruA [Corynebacterium qintianiae]|uniref:tRNA pseudouridine synthase A n=1 Tax=Corynebacterium qintianiae TaxID=2709392 RepID=A0A7T0PES9_9CORY|nr:tRNA pseudouridine(38-40) synthase TruA [Corynebacterium qintianiae]QPK83566.1 tRNA pseudouridine(38-40) synthase TruA [Corynebacterium qintianiae]
MTDETLRLRLDIAYDGTDFHGWARQADLRTVQGTIEAALGMVLCTPVELTVAGRTDAGVHASGQVAHVDIPRAALEQRSIEGDPARLVRRMAKLLPEDVRIFRVTAAHPLFDARFSALSRSYVYRVTTHPAGALPTRARDTAAWRRPVDLSVVQAVADAFVGLHDFAAFCKAKPNATTVREVLGMRWVEASTSEEPNLYEAHVTADAFCWNMVRALVATCLQVGDGSKEPGWVEPLLGERERNPQVLLAPAKGLTLVDVAYPAPDEYGRRSALTRAKRE